MKHDMIGDLKAAGINLQNYNMGPKKAICPRCSHTRKDKKDPCLWVNIKEADLALWKCHNCFWTGSAGNVTKGEHQPPEKREYKKPEPKAVPVKSDLPDNVVKFIEARGIPMDVVARNRLFYDQEKNALCFPYYVAGELLNVKYRGIAEKKFFMTKGAKLTFYGLDDLKPDDEELIIVEGEFDKLALEVCGLRNVISVPNGAPARVKEGDEIDNSGAFEYLAHAAALFPRFKKVILAVDNDEAGERLRFELARRIGAARCFVVKFPHKDANDTLKELGVDVTLDCLREAEPYPISGLYRVDDFQESLEQYFDGGMSAGAPTGWDNVDQLYTVMPGELTVVTGIPNCGKSEFIDALMINLAKRDNWRFACFSPENNKEGHVAKLAEKVIGTPISPKSPQRMSKEEFLGGAAWVNSYFYFIVADDDKNLPTIDWILEKAGVAVLRYGIKGLLIDPYNEIEHNRPAGMNETEFVSLMLSKVKRFARNHGIHVWMVAHPMKMLADKDGKVRVPTLYDISGSANWANKTDNGIVIHRSEDVSDTTEVHLKKVRFKHVGRKGKCELVYDKNNGRYAVSATGSAYPTSDEPDTHSWDA